MKRLFKKQMNKRPNKKRRFLFLLVGVATIAIVGIFTRQMYVNAQPCGPSPNNKLYTEASQAIESKDPKKLEDIVNSIKSISSYEKSVNCVYPVFYGYITNENAYEAQREMKVLQNAYFNGYSDISEVYNKIGFSSLKDAQKQLDRMIDRGINTYNEVLF